MKNKRSEPEDSPPQNRSFTVALEQMAQLLRTEIKLKDRHTKVLAPSSLPSLHNFVEQVAVMLRTQVQSKKKPKKRSWKNPSKPKK